MIILKLLSSNFVLITAGLSWLVAGVIKVFIELMINKKLSLGRIFGAGGMPSSHTSTVVALATSTGYVCGLDSSQFAITIIIAIVVIHDAVGVRQVTGKQSKILNKMIFDTNIFDKDFDLEKQLKEYIGHTPLQVVMGGIIGLLIALFRIRLCQ